MAKKLSNYVVSPLIQKLLIALGVTGYIATLATTLPTYFGVYADAWRMSQYTYAVAETVLLPLVLFGIAYTATTKKSPLLWRLSQAMLFAIIGRIVQVIVVQMMQFPIEQSSAEFGATLWYQTVTTLLVLAGYATIVRYYVRGKLAANSISPSLQRMFIVLTCSAVAIVAALVLYRVQHQYPFNPNLSGHVIGMIHAIAVPAILFVTAYFSSQKTTAQIARVFESLLLGVMGVILLEILADAVSLSKPAFLSHGSYGVWLAYELTIVAIGLVFFAIMLRFIRRQPTK